MHNFKLQKLIILIVYWWHSYWSFASMKDIRRKYSPTVDLSKFTFNKKILSITDFEIIHVNIFKIFETFGT